MGKYRPKKNNGGLVYSTEQGRLCPVCGQPLARCTCKKNRPQPSGDGIVRIRREVKGRGGKTVTTITGIPLSGEALNTLARELKQRCGSGGSVKEGTIIIQGDKREEVRLLLEQKGFTVRLAGG